MKMPHCRTTEIYLLLFKFLLFIYYNISCVDGTQRISKQYVFFELDYGGLHTFSRLYPIRFGTFFNTSEGKINEKFIKFANFFYF